MDLILTAIRNKYRYASIVGALSTEDLGDLPLRATRGPSLDQTARMLAHAIRDEGEESFVDEGKNVKLTELTNKLEIVKLVIAEKKAAVKAAAEAGARAEERQRLLEILHGKKTDELKDLSVEELEQRIESLTA